ncbi:MAG: hypothetical protein ACFNLK_04940 [Scardovia wiggsiae]
MSKHDLRARPVFHHQRDSIEAHPTMVMAALAVARHLQDTTAGHTITAQPQITAEAADIITAVQLPGH